MISKSTVFILGAGAHKPWGFPVMSELKSIIVQQFPMQYREYLKGIETSSTMINLIVTKLKEEFIDNFAFSPVTSIDRYLEENDKYAPEGKKAIIMNLLRYEKDLLTNFKEKGKTDNWFNHLFNCMVEDCKRNPDQIAENNIKFITFNYDRTLEFLFLRALFNTYTMKDIDSLNNIYKSIKIVHVYGTIGKIKEDREFGKPIQESYIDYGDEYSSHFSDIKSLENNILLIQERELRKNEEITKIITEADNIYFLGFSYGKENMKILGIPECLSPEQNIFGTTLYLYEKGKEYANKALTIKHNLKGTNKVVKLDNLTSLELLQKYLITD